MEYQVIWSQDAVKDVEEIASYIERDSFFYASSVVSRILQKTELLSAFPFSGRIVPEEGNDHVREHFVYNYRVIYEIKEDKLVVLAVVHGRRMLETLFKGRFNG